MKIHPEMPIYPCGTDVTLNQWQPTAGITIRTTIAIEAMKSMLIAAASEGSGPELVDSDFEAAESGEWIKDKRGYWRTFKDYDAKENPQRFRTITTHDQRLAREAVSQADALINELNKGMA